MYINHQQKTTFVMNVQELINLPLLMTRVSECATSTKVTEQLMAVQLFGEHGTEQKNYFLHLL
jgi:hypothetical protein